MPFAPPVTTTTLSFSCRSMHCSRTSSGEPELLSTKVEEASIERKVHTRYEGGRVGTKIKRKSCDLFRLGHAADRLRMGQFAEHFFFPARIVLPQVAVHKRRMDSSGRDAIAANVACEVIPGDGIGHGNHRALARRISKAVRQTRRARDGRHVENYAAAARFHVGDGGEHAVIDAFYVHLQNSVEVALRGGFEFANMRDTGIVHQGVDSAALRKFLKYRPHFLLVRDIAFMSESFTAAVENLLH